MFPLSGAVGVPMLAKSHSTLAGGLHMTSTARIVGTAAAVFALMIVLATTVDPWIGPALVQHRVAAFLGLPAPPLSRFALGYALLALLMATGYAWLRGRGATTRRDALLYGAFIGLCWLAPAGLVLEGHVGGGAHPWTTLIWQVAEQAAAGLLLWTLYERGREPLTPAGGVVRG